MKKPINGRDFRHKIPLDDEDGISRYFKSLRLSGATRILTQTEEVSLAKKIKAGDKKAREELIIHNLLFVASIAKSYLNRGLPFLDLVQEGNIGLMKAIARFKWQRGYRITTYSRWWIKQSIMRALTNKTRDIRLPVHIQTSIASTLRIFDRLSSELGRSATNEDVAKSLGISVRKIDELFSKFPHFTHLDDTPEWDDGEGASSHENVSDCKIPRPDDSLIAKEELDERILQVKILLQAVDNLTTVGSQHKRAFRLLYLFTNPNVGYGAILEKVRRMGFPNPKTGRPVSRERIRQMVNLVWKRLLLSSKTNFNPQNIKGYIRSLSELADTLGVEINFLD
jgi:RNA polymerase sigma factor (sigma-70 family)